MIIDTSQGLETLSAAGKEVLAACRLGCVSASCTVSGRRRRCLRVLTREVHGLVHELPNCVEENEAEAPRNKRSGTGGDEL